MELMMHSRTQLPTQQGQPRKYNIKNFKVSLTGFEPSDSLQRKCLATRTSTNMKGQITRVMVVCCQSTVRYSTSCEIFTNYLNPANNKI